MKGSTNLFKALSILQDDVTQMVVAIVVIGVVFTLLTLDFSLVIKATIALVAIVGGIFSAIFRK